MRLSVGWGGAWLSDSRFLRDGFAKAASAENKRNDGHENGQSGLAMVRRAVSRMMAQEATRTGNSSVQGLIALVAILAAFANPIAGLFWVAPPISMAMFMLRDAWILFAAVIILSMMRTRATELFAALFVVGALIFFLSAMLQEGSVGPSILFVQFRNLFGFFLAWALALWARDYMSPIFSARLLKALGWSVILYCAVELVVLWNTGSLISNTIFHKLELEQIKGTLSNIEAGLLDLFRIPGPLFSPSQLGIFVAYLYFVMRMTPGCRGRWMGLFFWLIQVVAISKTGLVMMLLVEVLVRSGKQLSFTILFSLFFAPFIADLVMDLLPEYHLASVRYHFLGYTSAFEALKDYPFGMGIGNVGTLAAKLQGTSSSAGFESGMGTIVLSFGVFALLVFGGVATYFMALKESWPFKLFVLYCAAMFFNENALSPHLFVAQIVLLVNLMEKVPEVPSQRKKIYLPKYSAGLRHSVRGEGHPI